MVMEKLGKKLKRCRKNVEGNGRELHIINCVKRI